MKSEIWEFHCKRDKYLSYQVVYPQKTSTGKN